MVESFVCEEEVFVVDAVLYQEPVKLDENRGDVVRWFGTGDDPGGRVLDDLQSVDEFGGESGEEGAAAVDAGSDKWITTLSSVLETKGMLDMGR